MSAKQDVAYARTAQDIERKYSFGKTFADMLGLINDNRDKVDSVESSLRNEITERETAISRTESEISAMATKTELAESINDVSESVSELSSKVEMKLDAEAVNIVIDTAMSNGVDRVYTTTGYKFDSDGLNISKTGEEMANKLDNTGMYVTRSGGEILTANNKGVEALNLHAKDYLIIGEGAGRSRFEDYEVNGELRTGCFWLGG